MTNQNFAQLQSTLDQYLPRRADLRAIVIIVTIFALAYVINRLLGKLAPIVTPMVADRADNATGGKAAQLRRAETWLSIGVAAARTIVVLIAIYLAWRLITPATAPVAIVGAGAFVAVAAGATLAPILRDITAGVVMMAERWYGVGDHVTVEPFGNLSGVVERITLRTTKLRSLNGEAIWLHNQYIQGVRVTTRGVRTMAIDTFVTDPERGKRVIEQALLTLPIGPTMIPRRPEISETEQLGEELWRITAIGQAAPGREWMIEDFAVKAITKHDQTEGSDLTVAYGPIVRHADEQAERRLKRSVRIKH